MASDLSKRPLPLNNFRSSVHKVLSNDDLLMEILLRLPILSLHLFTLVCKQWLSLITSSSFTLTRTRIRTVDPPSGLFIVRLSDNLSKFDVDFVSFDSRIPAKRSVPQLVCSGGYIYNSCNGLLLYYKDGNKYVCNPSISMFNMLPPIHDLNYEVIHMNIAFDPTKSPCYKVVHVGRLQAYSSEIGYDEIDYRVRIQTYSSETGVWNLCDDRFSYQWFDEFSDGIYWDGAIHWLNSYDQHVKLDIVDHPVLTNIQTPCPRTLRGHVYVDRKLFKSHGSLLLLCRDYECSRYLKIYEMKNEYSGWLGKYLVNLDDMMRPYPTLKMPANWCCRDHILSVVLGQQDEDSFMVIELLGNIVQYKFGLETISELFGFGKKNHSGHCFEYIASFAHA